MLKNPIITMLQQPLILIINHTHPPHTTMMITSLLPIIQKLLREVELLEDMLMNINLNHSNHQLNMNTKVMITNHIPLHTQLEVM